MFSIILNDYQSAMESATASSSEIGALLKSIIPSGVKMTSGYGTVSKTSYSFEFWCYFKDGTKKQNYALEDDGKIDGNKMDDVFEQMASLIRQSQSFDPAKITTVVFTLDQGSAKANLQKVDRSEGLYAIKKKLKAQLPK